MGGLGREDKGRRKRNEGEMGVWAKKKREGERVVGSSGLVIIKKKEG